VDREGVAGVGLFGEARDAAALGADLVAAFGTP
jgi:hypothetical protein